MTEAIKLERRLLPDGMQELIATCHFYHDFKNDPHPDEAIICVQAKNITPEIEALARADIRRVVEEHKVGDIR